MKKFVSIREKESLKVEWMLKPLDERMRKNDIHVMSKCLPGILLVTREKSNLTVVAKRWDIPLGSAQVAQEGSCQSLT